MDSLLILPNLTLDAAKPFGSAFRKKNVTTLTEAGLFLKNMPYGNLPSRDMLTALDAETGTCVHKHGILASCAREIGAPVFKAVGIYAMDAKLVPAVSRVLEKDKIDFIPATHCFLIYGHYRIDLTEGNCNGKTGPIDSYMHIQTVHPEISEDEEKRLYLDFLEKNGTRFFGMDSARAWAILRECGSAMKAALSCSML